jgi:ACR3 family arsenite efflux pump ArsB
MIAWTYPLRYFAGWPYEAAIDTTLIGSSSHFEAAIAVATTLYGIGLTIKFLSLNRSFMKLLEGSFMWKRSFMEKYGV